MGRNVEIKARARAWETQLERAAALASAREDIVQQDVFFPSSRGRLKLRTRAPRGGGDSAAFLIFYRRDDAVGPKVSAYSVCAVGDADAARRLLEAALGRGKTVRKHRTVFHCGQARIHFDEVEGLGRFLEVEVALGPEQGEETGAAVIAEWIERLDIRPEDLVAGAYADESASSRVTPTSASPAPGASAEGKP